MVDLPNIQLFIFFHTFVYLSRSKSFVGASLNYCRHLDHFVLSSQISDQRIDLILGADRSINYIIKKFRDIFMVKRGVT